MMEHQVLKKNSRKNVIEKNGSSQEERSSLNLKKRYFLTRLACFDVVLKVKGAELSSKRSPFPLTGL